MVELAPRAAAARSATDREGVAEERQELWSGLWDHGDRSGLQSIASGRVKGRAAVEWQVAHHELTRLARARAGLDFDEGKWLLTAQRASTHLRLGYGSFAEYIERLFGYAPRLTHDKLRVAEALEQLPGSAAALRAGQVSWSALRELTRVATPATEQAWLDAASGNTARDVERLVSGHRPGDRPTDPADPQARRHVLRFEVSGETLATFREAMAQIRRDAGGRLDDDAALLLLARRLLGGPTDVGRASYQVALAVCPQCQSARQNGAGEPIAIAPEMAAVASCDAQRLAPIDARNARTTAETETETETETHVGNARAGSNGRAAQNVPPAVRREVLRRDEHRCRFPGCRHGTFLDIHHLRLRAEGGSHDPDNLIAVCSPHHRALHRGEVSVEGQVATGLSFRHADGTAYGAAVSPEHVCTQTQAFDALRRLGFGESEVRRALARSAHACNDTTFEQLLRNALRLLTDRKLARAP